MADVEPMDVDNIASDFDDKENSLINSNVISKTPSVEKGYEQLDVSELNMKLRYSMTPSNSPMSLSYTANSKGDSGPNSLNNTVVVDSSLTRSLNTTVNKTDVLKAPKLPLQAMPTSQYTNNDRSCDREGDITVTITGTHSDDNLSLPSTSSSAVQTPEATTPTKEIPKSDGSPIMRGLKSVLNIFRSSHSPVPPENENENLHQEYSSKDNASIKASTPHNSIVNDSINQAMAINPLQGHPCPDIPAEETIVLNEKSIESELCQQLVHEATPVKEVQTNPALASTPISKSKLNDSKDSSKRNSPLKESVIFKEGLERELQWQEETEIFFKHEKIPVHKLLLQSGPLNVVLNSNLPLQKENNDKINTTVEYMDISNADVSYKSVIETESLNDIDAEKNNTKINASESDNEFVDCETTYTGNRSYILKTEVQSRISPVVFQIDNIPQESCLEDHITLNECNNDILTVVNNKTELQSQITMNESNNVLPEKNRLCHISEPGTSELTKPNLTCELHNNTDNTNVANNIQSVISSCTTIETNETQSNEQNIYTINLAFEENTVDDLSKYVHIPSETINLIPNQSCMPIHNSVEDSKPLEMKMQSNNLLHETFIETINDATSSVINLDTDDDNTTRILFKIDELLLNNIMPSNYAKDIGLNNTEISTITCENAERFNSNVLNTEDQYLLDEDKVLNDTVVITNNEQTNDNQIIMQTFVSGQNINDYTTSDDAKCIKDHQKNVKLESEEIEVDGHLCSEKDNISVMECELYTVNNINMTEDNKQPGLINNHKNISHIQNPHDVSMDSLELNVNMINEQQVSEIKADDFTHSKDCSHEQIYIDTVTGFDKTIEVKNNLARDVPSPKVEVHLDVPLPIHDETKKDSLQDILPEVEAEKPAINQCNISEPFQSLNISQCITNPSEIQIEFGCSIDVEMPAVGSNIQDIPFCKLSTNITSCLQDLNLRTNNTESPQITSKLSEIAKENNTTTLDVKANTQTEGNLNSKVIDNEIVTSENNSPYVSISEINLPNILLENLPKPENEIDSSSRISPKSSKKGYNVNFDEIENPFATKTNIRLSPPLGTPSRSFTPIGNFDEIENPFATKTNIRLSPPLQTPSRPFTPIGKNLKSKDEQRRPPNRVITQSERKKNNTNKKRFNLSVDSTVSNINKVNTSKTKQSGCIVDNSLVENKTDQDEKLYDVNTVNDPQNLISAFDENHVQNSYSSTHVDAPTDIEIQHSYSENIKLKHNTNINSEIKNISNMPIIDDGNFNPFATKSRICVTPPPSEVKDPLQLGNDTTTDNNTIEKYENESVSIDISMHDKIKVSSDTNNLTSSSINTEDKEPTIREVNTEDEDTIEGPFFEAEELVDVGKVKEIEIERGIENFKESISSNKEDLDKAELFIDAEAFEFLLNQNKSNVVADSGKESLFLKFDPLFAKRVSSEGAIAALSAIQKKQSTPKKLTRPLIVKPPQVETFLVPMAGTSNIACLPEVNNEEFISGASKPMMVVNPAIAKQPVATPRISLTPKTNRQSLNFASPAMVVIDRLLSLSSNTSLLDPDVTTDSNRNHEANIVLVELRELLAEAELHVHTLKCESKELRERLNMLESQVSTLESQGEERLKKVNMLNECLAEKTKMNKSMAVVVEEYERTIASLIAEMEQEKKLRAEERTRLINERDEQTAHLASMEGSFSDLHSKYEKCKQIILSMKANEDGYMKSFKEFDENLLKMQKNYDLLKQHATSKLNHANQELEKMKRSHDAEILKLTAIIKRKELHVISLEESLAQKSKANEELSAICDELISKVG